MKQESFMDTLMSKMFYSSIWTFHGLYNLSREKTVQPEI